MGKSITWRLGELNLKMQGRGRETIQRQTYEYAHCCSLWTFPSSSSGPSITARCVVSSDRLATGSRFHSCRPRQPLLNVAIHEVAHIFEKGAISHSRNQTQLYSPRNICYISIDK